MAAAKLHAVGAFRIAETHFVSVVSLYDGCSVLFA